MRSATVTMVCLLSALSVAMADPGDRSLVVIGDPAPGTAARLLAEGVMVVREMEGALIVTPSLAQLTWLQDAGFRCDVADTEITDQGYYTVSLRRPADLLEARRHARVLHHAEYWAIVAASTAEAERLSAAGLEVARIFMRPIRLARPVAVARRALPDTPDPGVQAIAAAVSGTRIDESIQRLQDFVTRYASHDSCQAAAQYIRAEFEAAGIDSVTFQHFSSTYNDNVVAVIPGVSQPEKTIIIGAHYDSITSNHENCPGADDDASGTACVLECARVLAGHPFDHTLKFVAFCAEEQGLLGSEAFASAAAAAGEDIIAAVAVDMIGYLAAGDAMDLDIIDNPSSVWLRDLAMAVGALYVPEFSLVDGSLPFGASSDHASFWANGYHAILLFEDTGSYSPYIHSSEDVVGLSYNSPELAVRSVRTAAALLATLAEPFRVAIAHEPVANTQNTTEPYRVVANIIAAGALDPDAVLVHYATGMGADQVPLLPTGADSEFEAFIPAQPAGTLVDYYLTAADTDGYQAIHPPDAPAQVHSFFVGTISTLLVHDHEQEQSWSVGADDDDATTGIWTRVDPNGIWENDELVQPEDDHTPDPGVMCFVTGNAPAGSSQGTEDVDGGKTTLLSPVFDLSGYPFAWVQYWRWYTNNTGFNPGTDEWRVDVSADGGQSWVNLEALAASHRSWQLVERNLLDYIMLTNQVQLRFVASDDEQGSVVEAAVDDFAILVSVDSVTGIGAPGESPASRIWLAQNVPNPFNPVTTIRFHVPPPGREVSLKIYDVMGRQVRTLVADQAISGAREVLWRGDDDRGRAVSSGVYFYGLEDGAQRLTRKLTLLR